MHTADSIISQHPDAMEFLDSLLSGRFTEQELKTSIFRAGVRIDFGGAVAELLTALRRILVFGMVPPEVASQSQQSGDNHRRDSRAIALRRAKHLVLTHGIINFAQEHVLFGSLTFRKFISGVLRRIRTQGQCARFLQSGEQCRVFSG